MRHMYYLYLCTHVHVFYMCVFWGLIATVLLNWASRVCVLGLYMCFNCASELLLHVCFGLHVRQ